MSGSCPASYIDVLCFNPVVCGRGDLTISLGSSCSASAAFWIWITACSVLYHSSRPQGRELLSLSCLVVSLFHLYHLVNCLTDVAGWVHGMKCRDMCDTREQGWCSAVAYFSSVPAFVIFGLVETLLPCSAEKPSGMDRYWAHMPLGYQLLVSWEDDGTSGEGSLEVAWHCQGHSSKPWKSVAVLNLHTYFLMLSAMLEENISLSKGRTFYQGVLAADTEDLSSTYSWIPEMI